MAWMCIGYGIFGREGPIVAGLSDVVFSGFQHPSDVGHALTLLPAACSITIIVGGGAAKIPTRALSVLLFVTAAIGAPVAARALWIPQGGFPNGHTIAVSTLQLQRA